ncbi:hypothetical protein [Sorangium sp. So ce854]|uniref:hypothetical protein n=1 Tax=Sorangium sp. So ce854 TaxID=3133322 RepID=UPI003F5DA7E0
MTSRDVARPTAGPDGSGIHDGPPAGQRLSRPGAAAHARGDRHMPHRPVWHVSGVTGAVPRGWRAVRLAHRQNTDHVDRPEMNRQGRQERQEENKISASLASLRFEFRPFRAVSTRWSFQETSRVRRAGRAVARRPAPRSDLLDARER